MFFIYLCGDMLFLQVCCVTRLVPQKGVHLLRQAIFHVLKQGGQFILQGTSVIPAIKVFSIILLPGPKYHYHIVLKGISHAWLNGVLTDVSMTHAK